MPGIRFLVPCGVFVMYDGAGVNDRKKSADFLNNDRKINKFFPLFFHKQQIFSTVLRKKQGNK